MHIVPEGSLWETQLISPYLGIFTSEATHPYFMRGLASYWKCLVGFRYCSWLWHEAIRCGLITTHEDHHPGRCIITPSLAVEMHIMNYWSLDNSEGSWYSSGRKYCYTAEKCIIRHRFPSPDRRKSCEEWLLGTNISWTRARSFKPNSAVWSKGI